MRSTRHKNKPKKKRRCKKCKSTSLIQEPACIKCLICSWVKYNDRGNVDRLWKQHILNRQFMSNLHWVQLKGVYCIETNQLPKEELGEKEDIARAYINNDRTHPDTGARNPHATRQFIKEQMQ